MNDSDRLVTPARAEGATMRCLRALGFTDRTPDYASTKLGYKMGGWELSAREMINRSFVPIVSVDGILRTPNSLSRIEIEMLQTFDQPEMAAAFLVFGLDRHKRALETLPDWWELGEANLDLHPVVQERKRDEARMEAWRARPHCRMAADHARLFRRQLRAAIDDLVGEEPAILTFDGQVLRAVLSGKEIAALASGDAWSHSVSWPLRASMKLPGRFTQDFVVLGFFDGTLDWENYRYPGATEVW